jgi:hypothetical protein
MIKATSDQCALRHFAKMPAPDRPMAGAAATMHLLERSRVIAMVTVSNPRALRPHPVGGWHFRKIPSFSARYCISTARTPISIKARGDLAARFFDLRGPRT